MEDFWKERYALIDLLFGTNLSLADIAKELGVSQSYLSREIKELNLDWVKRKNRKMSRGQSCLTYIMTKLLPNQLILNEYHIGEQLRLDVFCPAYKLAAEYHGRQHYEHIPMFHPTYEDFIRAQERDERKIELCTEQGITLVSFKYNDDLNEDIVYNRLLDALKKDTAPRPRKAKPRKIENPFYEQIKSKRKEFERDLRAKIKEDRKIRKDMDE